MLSLRERASGMYYASAYFLAKSFGARSAAAARRRPPPPARAPSR